MQRHEADRTNGPRVRRHEGDLERCVLPVRRHRGPGAADKIGDTGPLAVGQIFSFGNYDAANATNDVDFQITFADSTTQKSRFHLSCSDPEMQDIGDCGQLEGNGKDNSVTGGNLWLLRDLQGHGNHMCNFP